MTYRKSIEAQISGIFFFLADSKALASRWSANNADALADLH